MWKKETTNLYFQIIMKDQRQSSFYDHKHYALEEVILDILLLMKMENYACELYNVHRVFFIMEQADQNLLSHTTHILTILRLVALDVCPLEPHAVIWDQELFSLPVLFGSILLAHG